MSRLARKPIPLNGATFTVKEGVYSVKGPKGELEILRLPGVDVTVTDEGVASVGRTGDDRQSQVNLGTQWALVKNAAIGVTEGFTKNLEIQGVGYRAAMEGSTLNLSLGFSHPVTFPTPAGLTISVDKNIISISGANKEDVGQAAAVIRKYRKPEPYKGKGIRYQGEVVRMKAGKKAGK
jgi:large subunit ribosomal protein L6